MQTTTPHPQVTEVPSDHSNGKRTIKSFTDLSGAIIDAELDQVALLIRQGVDTWRTAGTILVETCRRQPDVFRMMQARYPHISASLLQTMAAIGRGEIWPWLLLDSSMGARALLQCNYDLQKKYSEDPIEVVIAWDGEKKKTVKKKISELSRAEVAMVFPGNGTMNDLDKQAWRLRVPAEIAPKATELGKPYAAVREVSVVIGHVEILVQSDGSLKFEPCKPSAQSQSVRVDEDNKKWSTKIAVYKRVYQ